MSFPLMFYGFKWLVKQFFLREGVNMVNVFVLYECLCVCVVFMNIRHVACVCVVAHVLHLCDILNCASLLFFLIIYQPVPLAVTHMT